MGLPVIVLLPYAALDHGWLLVAMLVSPGFPVAIVQCPGLEVPDVQVHLNQRVTRVGALHNALRCPSGLACWQMEGGHVQHLLFGCLITSVSLNSSMGFWGNHRM